MVRTLDSICSAAKTVPVSGSGFNFRHNGPVCRSSYEIKNVGASALEYICGANERFTEEQKTRFEEHMCHYGAGAVLNGMNLYNMHEMIAKVLGTKVFIDYGNKLINFDCEIVCMGMSGREFQDCCKSL